MIEEMEEDFGKEILPQVEKFTEAFNSFKNEKEQKEFVEFILAFLKGITDDGSIKTSYQIRRIS